MSSNPAIWRGVGWSAVTIGLYVFSKGMHRRYPSAWTTPNVLAPLLLLATALLLHINSIEYLTSTHWLMAFFAPATVAFAIPVYQERALIRAHWPLLVAAALIGSLTAVGFSLFACHWLHLDDELRRSLVPRSISTAFAVSVSGRIGGTPPLTAVFVMVTGVFGAAIGELVLTCLPLRSVLARGALYGMGAHGFGAARALQINREIGSVAGLVMVFSGLLNVLASPLLARLLQ